MKPHTSISHLNPKAQYRLLCIKKTITKQLQPLILYCYKTDITYHLERNCFSTIKRAESTHFSCSLLAVLPNEAQTPDPDALKVFTAPFGEVNIKIHSLEEVKTHLAQGNIFFSWIYRTGIVLYEKAHALDLLPPPMFKKKEFRQAVEAYYAKDPEMPDYLEVCFVPTEKPVDKPFQSSEKKKPVVVNLRFEIRSNTINPVFNSNSQL